MALILILSLILRLILDVVKIHYDMLLGPQHLNGILLAKDFHLVINYAWIFIGFSFFGIESNIIFLSL